MNTPLELLFFFTIIWNLHNWIASTRYMASWWPLQKLGLITCCNSIRIGGWNWRSSRACSCRGRGYWGHWGHCSRLASQNSPTWTTLVLIMFHRIIVIEINIIIWRGQPRNCPPGYVRRRGHSSMASCCRRAGHRISKALLAVASTFWGFTSTVVDWGCWGL